MGTLTKTRAGVVFALITACSLGSITTQAKLVFADGGNALTLMLARFFVSTLAFGLLLMLRRDSFRVAASQRLPVAALGLFWSGGMIFYLSAVEHISVSLGVLILYFYPLLVLAYALSRRQIKASPGLFALFLGAFCGLYLALSGGRSEIALIGVFFAALASCGAAFTFICGARVAPTLSPLLMAFWVNAIGLVMILPLMWNAFALPDATGGLIALTTATAFYLVAILSQFQALARLPAAQAAFLLNLEPVVSILLARLVLDEVLTVSQWAGIVLVISMIIISLRFKPDIT